VCGRAGALGEAGGEEGAGSAPARGAGAPAEGSGEAAAALILGQGLAKD